MNQEEIEALNDLLSEDVTPPKPQNGVYYHGTVKLYLEEILKEGLQPKPDEAFKIQRMRDGSELRDNEESGFVYLASTLGFAKEMASVKAEYLRTLPGNKIKGWLLTKDFGTPVEHTSPVILKVTLPEGFQGLERDTNSQSDGGFRYKGTINPEFISVISGGENESQTSGRKRIRVHQKQQSRNERARKRGIQEIPRSISA